MQSGVKVLDIGAQSTAPKADPIGPEEEKARLVPFIGPLLELSQNHFFIVSLDTYRFETAHFFFEKLLSRGPQRPILWNSVAGVQDAVIGDFLSRFPNAEYVYTHNLAPGREESARHLSYVEESRSGVELLMDGWSKAFKYFKKHELLDRIWWDPGFGFSKTFDQNEQLLALFADEKQFASLPNIPHKLVLGIGRKSFLRRRFLLDHPETLENERLFAHTKALHSAWLKRWKMVLKKEGRAVQVLIRLHDPGVFPKGSEA